MKTRKTTVKVPQDIDEYVKEIKEPLATFLWRSARRIIRLENKE